MHDRAQHSSRIIAIIGGGFSGAATAYHIAKRATEPTEIVIFEPRKSIGRGVAYDLHAPHLLLNVPAAKLSIDPKIPGDFHAWCLACGRASEPGTFHPRAWFAAYTESRLLEALAAANSPVTIRHIPERAARLRTTAGGMIVEGLAGDACAAERVVLALGHGPTRLPPVFRQHAPHPTLLRSPWNESAMAVIATRARRIMLVGTGLTMCDATFTLTRLGFSGEFIAVSRRGLIPRAHAPSHPEQHADWARALTPGSFRDLRKNVIAATRGEHWRDVIDTLRPHTARLWAAMPTNDQRRFADRLAPYWDAHRHRLAPSAWQALQELITQGRLQITRGRILDAMPRSLGWTCDIRAFNTDQTERIETDAIVLCTGPNPDPARWDDPLVNDLLNTAQAMIEPNRLGLMTDDRARLLDAQARPQPGLFALGPLRRGALWESTAVPEIMVQADKLANELTSDHAKADHATSY